MMASTLRSDALYLVFEQVSQKKDLLPLSLFSKHFHSLVAPLIYRSITLSADSKSRSNCSHILLTRLRVSAALCGFVQEVTFSLPGSYFGNLVDRFETLLSAFDHLGGVHWLHWYSPQQSLLRKLCEFKPSARIYLPDTFPLLHWENARGAPIPGKMILDEPSSISSSLFNKIASRMLCSLNIYVGARDRSAWDAKMDSFWALKNCHNLKILAVLERDGETDDIPFSINNEVYPTNYGFCPGDTLPQLIELSFEADVFTKADMAFWGANGDWTKLKLLELNQHTLVIIECLQGCKNSLKSMTLTHVFGKGCTALLNVFCPRLTCL